MNRYHQEILEQIEKNSGKPTQHTFLNHYLGSKHPRYPISNPVMRTIARHWMNTHRDVSNLEIADLINSLIKGKSFTEKCIAGILLDYCLPSQRNFNPKLFEDWLLNLEGWAEVDTLCTGRYSENEIPLQWNQWKKLLLKFSNSKHIQHRRASLVLLCGPLRKKSEPELAEVAFVNIRRMKSEKEILITKAISWILRTMVKHHRMEVKNFIAKEVGLPAIALRETKRVLLTGKKN